MKYTTSDFVLIGIFCFFIFIMVYIILNAVNSETARRRQLKERLLNLAEAKTETKKEVSIFIDTKEAGVIEQQIQKLLSPVKRSKKIQDWYQQTGIDIPLVNILTNLISASVVLMAILKVFTNIDLWKIIIYVFAGSGFITFMTLNFFRSRRQKQFTKEMPDTLTMIVQFLKAGFNLDAAFEITAKEGPPLIGNELKKILSQTNSGIAYENALRNSYQRVGLNIYFVFIGALIIQHRLGASATLIIENIIFILQKRTELNEKVKTMSAEATATYAILIGTQVLLALALCYASPKQMLYFIDDPDGRYMAMVIVFMLVLQFLTFRWLTKIKVE